MKKQINPSTKAHLLRGAFYLLLLLAVCVIPFALGQRDIPRVSKRSTSVEGPRRQRQPQRQPRLNANYLRISIS